MSRLLIVLIVSLSLITSTRAQEIPEYLVFDANLVAQAVGIQPDSMYWSWDSQQLFIALDQLGDFGQIRYQYDVNSEQLEEIDRFPFQIELTDEQQEHFHASSSAAVLAPNGENFVYGSESTSFSPVEGGYYQPPFAIGNFSERTFQLLPGQVVGNQFRWSDDSSSFVSIYETPYGVQNVFSYVRSYNVNCFWSFCQFAVTFIGGMDHHEPIYDISPMGIEFCIHLMKA